MRLALDNAAPRSMRDEATRTARRAMLTQPHMVPLAAFTKKLRELDMDAEVPEFDPKDGGVNAKVLFLFEKPGPMTSVKSKKPGSGFVSRDNDDPTAAATFTFMARAGIPRKLTVLWNAIPWWDGKIDPSGSDRKLARAYTKQLINDELRRLKAVVLVGREAQKLKRFLAKNTKLKVFESFHPSPQVYGTNRDLWDSIPLEWIKVREFIEAESLGRPGEE